MTVIKKNLHFELGTESVRRDSTVQFKGLTAHVSVLAEVRKTDKMFSVW